jgi:hypothetical protein
MKNKDQILLESLYSKIFLKEGYDSVEYDEDGNRIEIDSAYNTEKRYDRNENLVYYKDMMGRIELWEFDDHNHLMYHKYSDGSEVRYNNRQQQIYAKDAANGDERFWEYEDKPRGNIIHYRDTIGVEEFNKYDKNGEKIYYKRIEKGFVVTEWERIFEGKDCVYYKDLVLNKERFYTYEKNGISSKKTIYTDENLGENWRYVNGNLKYNWKTRIIKDT